MGDRAFFLGRQPIIGAKCELVAYELLFRSSQCSAATMLDDSLVSANFIKYAFTDLDIESALGGKRGFINVSQAMLTSDTLKLLPRESVVLKIPQAMTLSPNLVAQCEKLRSDGYSLALDDVVALGTPALAVLPFISVVHINAPAMRPEDIEGLAQQARQHGALLLASKIDTVKQYQTCWELGFDLYQGYYFARPVILPGNAVQSSSLVLLKLVSLIAQDVPTEELEDALKHAPDLTLRLLRTVNSAALNRQRKIESVQNAIIVLGRTQLNRLVQIMMFRHQNRETTGADPVTTLAVLRGRVMETVAQQLGWSAVAGQAFMTGMLSLVDTLFGQELSGIIDQLSLDPAVTRALLYREGDLGLLLLLAEASELEDSARAAAILQALGLHDLDAFNRIQVEALKWASNY